ncbi:MAG: polymer-forming cytoskeletal protein [Anaerolineae bacterium]|jgi:hypothetical protein|nr:polymer-forming cytoskeletal protein [Anaerolineae bacterium]MBT7075304.1 polymer-forming cytoskeletal protein [Anaerolineae bacterium]MBT7781885.1 polymer-forming cytoskeletal protein [Anaerolineae bacterium]
MSTKTKIFSTLAIFFLLALTIVPTASAFEGIEDTNYHLEEDEVVEETLYIGAETIVIDGIIKGDLYAGAQSVTINGTIEGDLYTGAQSVEINGIIEGDLVAFAQSVLINGVVEDDLRAGATALQLGKEAKIGDDLLFGGASLETKAGSMVLGDILVGAAQVLATGDVDGDIVVGAGAFELKGNIAGHLKAYVEPNTDGNYIPPMSYGPPPPFGVPQVKPGITIDKKASVGENFSYTAYSEISFPTGVVAGETLRVEPSYAEFEAPAPPTTAEVAGYWALDWVRTVITLFLVGLVFMQFFPNLLHGAGHRLQTQPLPSFGWGMVSYVVFYLSLFLIVLATIIGAMVFGIITLGSLSGMIIIVGMLLFVILILAFVIATAYLTKIIVSVLGGNLILARTKPEWVNHKVYPLLVGVILLSLIISIPLVGWLIKFVVILLGLGALWILGREQFAKKDEALVEA